MNYIEFLKSITQERKELQNERERLLKSSDGKERVKGLKMLSELTSLIALQDKLINHVALLEKKNISEVRDEFEFTY